MLTCPTCHHQYPASEQFCSRDGAILLSPDGVAADATLKQLIPGGYQIEERLGEGGMGIVYRTTQLSTRQNFAIKILRNEYTQNQDILNRFYQEAHAVSQLQHPNISQVLETGTLPDGRPYLLLEYLQGADLATILQEKGSLPEEKIIEIALQATSALQAAHTHGIIHRDLKPDNIFLCKDPSNTIQAKLLDFGLAKLLRKNTDEISREEARTRSGVIMGTPYYMSPEQACGKPVDEQTDIYALGVILYEMLVGRVPFRSPDGPLHVLMQHLNETPIPPSELLPGVSPSLEQLILHCLSKEKSQRYPSAEVLHQDLLSLQRKESLSFRPGKPKQGKKPLAVALSLTGLLAVMGSWYAFAEREKKPAPYTPTTVSSLSQPTSVNILPPSQPTQITLTIETKPEGAKVFLDGAEQAGLTPLVLTIAPTKEATLTLQKEGFEEISQPVSLQSSLLLQLPLTKIKKKNPKEDSTPPDQLDPYDKKKK